MDNQTIKLQIFVLYLSIINTKWYEFKKRKILLNQIRNLKKCF